MRNKFTLNNRKEYQKREVTWPLAILLALMIALQIHNTFYTIDVYRLFHEGIPTTARVYHISSARGGYLNWFTYYYDSHKGCRMGDRMHIGDTVNVRYLKDKPSRYIEDVELAEYRWVHE